MRQRNRLLGTLSPRSAIALWCAASRRKPHPRRALATNDEQLRRLSPRRVLYPRIRLPAVPNSSLRPPQAARHILRPAVWRNPRDLVNNLPAGGGAQICDTSEARTARCSAMAACSLAACLPALLARCSVQHSSFSLSQDCRPLCVLQFDSSTCCSASAA